MSIFNALHPKIYTTGTTSVVDIDNELALAEDIRFSTGYPGGFLSASFFLKRDITRSWQLRAKQRIAFINGTKIVWEGFITNFVRSTASGGDGFQVEALGAWGAVLGMRQVDKRWADNRVAANVWRFTPDETGEAKCRLKRSTTLEFLPTKIAWVSADYVQVWYRMPTGETVKKVIVTYDLTTANSEKWGIALYDAVGGTSLWSVARTTDGTSTATVSHTLASPTQTIAFRFTAGGDQTPAGDGTSYGKLSALTVYSETSAIDLTEIARDLITEAATVSTDEALISSNTLSVAPFISKGFEELSSILARAALQGDSSANQWAVGFWESERAAAPDGKPVMFVEQYPALTDFEYIFRLVPGSDVELSQDFSEIFNFIIVQYRDPEGITCFLTPDDDASLKDAASIATYGQHDFPLVIGDGDTTTAADLGQRFLAARKDPQWRVTSPLSFQYYIEHKNGFMVPTSQVRAGERIRIDNFQEDLSGTGLTFLITMTDYTDESETVSLTVGIPDNLAIVLGKY